VANSLSTLWKEGDEELFGFDALGSSAAKFHENS